MALEPGKGHRGRTGAGGADHGKLLGDFVFRLRGAARWRAWKLEHLSEIFWKM